MSETDTQQTITLDTVRQSLYAAVICDALDGLGYRHQALHAAFGAMTGVPTLVGRCKTTLWADMAHVDPNPYELELIAVDGCKPGDVMIAAAHGSMRSGVWGELLSTAARNAGCIGALVDGAVRDVAKMTEMGFPCFSRGVSPYDSQNRQRVIDVDVPVDVAGVTIQPDDLIVIDHDGAVVVPQQVEQAALQAAWNKVHDENVTRDAIKQGMKATEAYEKYGVL